MSELQLENDRHTQKRDEWNHNLENLIAILQSPNIHNHQNNQNDSTFAKVEVDEQNLNQELNEFQIQQSKLRSKEQEFAVVKENFAQTKELIQATNTSN
jgi:hypothetical protein